MTEVYLSLGSNIEPESNMLHAIRAISRVLHVTAISTVYRTTPVSRESQPDFFNCVVKVETEIEAQALKFDVLRPLEAALGRRRTGDRYAPRTIDIDVVLYGDERIDARELTIPDPDIFRRPFLAIPLSELSPELEIPGSGKKALELAAEMDRSKMVPLPEFTRRIRAEI